MPICRRILAKARPALGVVIAFTISGCVTMAPAKAPQSAVTDADLPHIVTLYGDFLAGRHAQFVRDFKTAEQYFGRALSHFPDNESLLHRNLSLAMVIGDFDKAAALSERMIKKNIVSDRAHLINGIAQVRQGDFKGANEAFSRLPLSGINIFLRPMVQAWSQVGAGDPDAALKTLSVMLERKELITIYNFHAGLINDQAGRRDTAEAFYLKPSDDPGGLTPRSADILAAFYLQGGQTDKAAKVFDTYLQDHPDSLLIQDMKSQRMNGPATRPVDTASHGLAEALFDTATSLRQSGAADLALFYTQTSLALEPDFPLARLLLGDIWHSLGRYDEAIASYQSIPDSSAISYSAKLRLTSSLFSEEKANEAVSVLTKLSQSRPDRIDALIKLGRFFNSAERYKDSAAAYSLALDRIPVIEPYHWELFFSRGISYERAKIWDKAEPDFLKALELFPDQPSVLNYLGYSWLEKGMHLKQAREMIIKAIELRPQDGFITDSLGWVYYLAGEYDKALKELKRAVELEPSDATINEHYGDALWKVGREIEARFQWTRALSLEPPPNTIPGIKDKLENGMPEDGKK